MVPFEVLEVERALYHKALEADLDQTVESAQGAFFSGREPPRDVLIRKVPGDLLLRLEMTLGVRRRVGHGILQLFVR